MARDVKMKGFEQRSTVRQAWEWIDRQATARRSETVVTGAAAGRVLAQDVRSALDVPAFDRSAMDGYAVRAEETAGASDYNPLRFRVVGESFPGRGCERTVTPGTAVRIMTGAPLPHGATAVVPAEYARSQGEEVQLTLAVAENKHVSRRGEDVALGAVLLSKGRRLRPQDVASLASIGVAEVDVYSQPIIRIVVTGNELVEPGQPLGAGQIYEANSFMLRPLVLRDGGIVEDPVRRLPDDREALRGALSEPGADVVLVSGGSSVGAEDHAPMLVAELGELPLHGIAMRPSSPAGMGRIGPTLLFLLPGNPVSCLCAYDFFAGRAIRRIGGLCGDWPYQKVRLPVARKIVSAVGRVDYCRVQCTAEGVIPVAVSGAAILSSTTRADGFVVIPEDLEGYAAGSAVEVYLYDSLSLAQQSQVLG